MPRKSPPAGVESKLTDYTRLPFQADPGQDIKPDWRSAKLLASLEQKNTAANDLRVQRVLADGGIEVVDPTHLFNPLLAGEGVLTRRKPSNEE